MMSLPRIAPILLPPIGPFATGVDFWMDNGIASFFRDTPIAVVVAIPWLAIPSFLLGLGLASLDRHMPKYRRVWVGIGLVLAAAIIFLGSRLGPQMNF